jgi:quinol monooxygenase YgiN
MAITRINQFEAKAGEGEKLHAFLRSVITTIEACKGCLSVRLLRSAEQAERLAIVEEWESIEAHQAAASAIPREQMAEAVALFASPPAGMYYRE